MKRIALMLLTGALLANSVNAYANGTAVIMYGRYVTSIDNSNKTGPTAGTTGTTDTTGAANTAGTTDMAGTSDTPQSVASAEDTEAAKTEAATETTSDTTAQSADSPKIITSVTGVQGTGSNSSTDNSTAASAASDASASADAADLANLNIPADATVLATLKGSMSGDTGTFTLFTKVQSADGTVSWTKLGECTAKYGKAGLGKSQEGDNKTPVGVFKMNTPFGIKAAEEGFPANYIKVDGNNYWNGDSASELYNKLVSTKTYTDFKTGESEHLIKYAPYYNYCIDTGYNADGTPYKGSAIFLHCVVGDENTHGCIAIPEANMKEVLRAYAEGTTYIAITPES